MGKVSFLRELEGLHAMELYVDIATPEELERHFGYPPSPEEISLEREFCLKDPDGNYQDLYLLYLVRGDKKTAQIYLNKIKDPRRRRSALMIAHECSDASMRAEERR